MLFAFNKMKALSPIEKIFNAKTMYLGQHLERLAQKRKEKAFKSMTVYKLKKNGIQLGAKLIWKVQNSLFQRNMRTSFDDLSRNKLLALVHELSHEN